MVYMAFNAIMVLFIMVIIIQPYKASNESTIKGKEDKDKKKINK